MAEAVVDGTPMSRFFCHKCRIEIERLLPDYTCPRCASGFIEELESGNNDSEMDISTGMNISPEVISFVDPDSPGYNHSLLEATVRELILSMGIQNPEVTSAVPSRYNTRAIRGRNVWSRNPRYTRRSNSSRGRQEAMGPMSVERYLQDFILNFSGMGLGYPMSQEGQSPILFSGNPGDYVWGRDGLDAIVTQLLNQMDGAGPPPLPRKQIDEIPTITVVQNQVDSKLQCSVCWEDFKLSEPVRQLPCQHLYHAPCIVPWLELHGTCPICRQSLGDQNSAEANQDTVGPSLAALFRAANESNSTRMSSTSSSSGSSSNNNSTSEI